MKLIETKGDVKFFEDNNKVLYQQIGNDKVEKVNNGITIYKHIKKIGDFNIVYDLNGVDGFCIKNNDGIYLEDRIWTLKEAEEIAKEIQSLK